jgi:hypothetical protein
MMASGGSLCPSIGWSKALVVSKGQRDPVTERVQKIVFPLLLFVANSESFDLINQMIPRLLFVYRSLIEGMVRVFDSSPMNIAGH